MGLIHKPLTPARIEANRHNALRSTGPRSARGKAIVRFNAAKHWGRAEAFRPFMPALGEDPKEFEALRDGLYRSLDPQDEFETMLVDEMAENRWRLRRMIKGEAAAMAAQRRERKAVLDQRRAEYEGGGWLNEAERQLIEYRGFVGLHDSPAKFYRVLEILKALRTFVEAEGFPGEGEVYLKTIYGPNPGIQGMNLIAEYQRGREKGEAGDAAEERERRESFLKALDAEIARFEAQAERDRQARRDLAEPRVELELLNARLDPSRIVRYQETLERRFDRKWKLFRRYRRARKSGRDSDIPAIETEATDGDQAGQGEAAGPEIGG